MNYAWADAALQHRHLAAEQAVVILQVLEWFQHQAAETRPERGGSFRPYQVFTVRSTELRQLVQRSKASGPDPAYKVAKMRVSAVRSSELSAASAGGGSVGMRWAIAADRSPMSVRWTGLRRLSSDNTASLEQVNSHGSGGGIDLYGLRDLTNGRV